ncbi:MAG: hypothetical protein H7Y38_07540 [Armatimonadetes bacterium]|nr:hypothetical protein [Armatimonadota bacterium]
MPVLFAPAASDFHAQHSPFGAFASFTVGRHGQTGGFGLELGAPAKQDVYVALVRGNDSDDRNTVRALPFYTGAQNGGAEAYTGAATTKNAPVLWNAYAPDEIKREMGFATDSWTTNGGLTFRLLTPFGAVPDPLTKSDDALRAALCPAILAEVTLDNTAHEGDAWAFFGVADADPLRPLSDVPGANLCGMARETCWGFATFAADDVQESQDWNLQEKVAGASVTVPQTVQRLANRGGLLLHVPPGESKTFTVALGFYRGGVVTSGVSASYLYSRLFTGLEDVLAYALKNADATKRIATERDAELDAAPLNESRRFLLAHATHSYHASTMLLHDETGDLVLSPRESCHRPLWVVNEGEYRMMNTFDLTVDQAFWELKYHPWTLRNTLDLFCARYRYYDEAQDATDPSRPRFLGGISFTHDMGVANAFSPHGYSSYERPNLDDCFSYMTAEQLLNWCLTAALYGITTGDRYWLGLRHDILVACLHSLLHRDGPDGMRNGIISLDSSRCENGQEITTYDSLDASLGQSRSNAYIAVKTWATYLALGRCFHLLGHDEAAALSEEQAALAAQAIASHFDAKEGYLPAVFEGDNPGNASRIVPAIEGLAFPYLLGDRDAVSETGPFGELISLLKTHLATVLQKGVCIDTESGGVKMSSTSTNTWMSKIFLSQFVAESVLGVRLADSVDDAHAKWQTQGAARNFAFTDQVTSDDGTDLGSRYYPRGVTAVLWLRPR